MLKEFMLVEPPTASYSGINIYVEAANRYADFSIRYYTVGLGPQASNLEAFDDCWYVLFNYCQDLLAELAKLNNARPTREKLAEVLIALGYEDKTPKEGN